MGQAGARHREIVDDQCPAQQSDHDSLEIGRRVDQVSGDAMNTRYGANLGRRTQSGVRLPRTVSIG